MQNVVSSPAHNNVVNLLGVHIGICAFQGKLAQDTPAYFLSVSGCVVGARRHLIPILLGVRVGSKSFQ